MASKKIEHRKKSLLKVLIYILGYEPDEFALMPDKDGFILIKDLVKALNEDEGWKNLREREILELFESDLNKNTLEIVDKKIRLNPEEACLKVPEPPGKMPKIMYFALKPNVWPIIADKGLGPKNQEEYLKLWVDKEQALREGRRVHHQAVLIKVSIAEADNIKADFKKYSDRLWLAKFLTPSCLSGPSIVFKEEQKAPLENKREAKEILEPKIDLVPKAYSKEITHKGKVKGRYSDSPDWKNQLRKEKRRRERD